jgi:hypothetical protein
VTGRVSVTLFDVSGAHTIQVKVRYGDFTTLTRQITIEAPLTEASDIYRLATDHRAARFRRRLHILLHIFAASANVLPRSGLEPNRRICER